jgi:hypothetical protein
MTDPPKRKQKRKYPPNEERKVATTVDDVLMRVQAKKLKSAPEGEDEFVIRWQAPALQADFILEKLRSLNPSLSTIELVERSIPGPFDFLPSL